MCSICKYGSEYKYCETCGNDTQNSADPNALGINHLVKAYDAARWDREDYPASLNEFQGALRYKDSLPPVLLMVTWFEYAMSITKVVGAVDLKHLSTPQLIEFTKAIEESQRVYESLSVDVKETIRSPTQNYPMLFGQNLGEARRALDSRGVRDAIQRTEIAPDRPSQAASQSGRITPSAAHRREGEANGDKYTFAHTRAAERLEVASTGIRCVRCLNHVIPLSPCPNCGNTIFLWGADVLNVTGLFCLSCRNSFTSIECICGCQNPIEDDTIMRLKGK